MTVSYDPAEADTISQVRGIIADGVINVATAHFQDATITARIAKASGNLNLAAADLLRAWASFITATKPKQRRFGDSEDQIFDPKAMLDRAAFLEANEGLDGVWERIDATSPNFPRMPWY